MLNFNLMKIRTVFTFFRNNKKYFFTTITNNKMTFKNRQIGFKSKLNLLKLNLLKNTNGFKKRTEQLKLLLTFFKKEFKKQYNLRVQKCKKTKMQRFKLNPLKQILSDREKLFLKRIIFKKVLAFAIKKMNIYVYNRAKILYKQLKKDRIKLYFSYQKKELLHNKRILNFLLKKVKQRHFLYTVRIYEKFLKNIVLAQQSKKTHYFVSLNLWRSQEHNYFRYYVYRRKAFHFRKTKGVTLFPWVNQRMRTYFSKKSNYPVSVYKYYRKHLMYTNKKKYRFFKKHGRYQAFIFLYNIYKFRVQQRAKVERRIYKKYNKNDKVVLPIKYFIHRHLFKFVRHTLGHLKTKQKIRKKRLLFHLKKKTVKYVKYIKKRIKTLFLKKKQVFIAYKKKKTLFNLVFSLKVKRSFLKYNNSVVRSLKNKKLLSINRRLLTKRFLLWNQLFLVFLKQLFILKKKYYNYQRHLVFLKKQLKRKRLLLSKHAISLVPILLRLRNRVGYLFGRRQQFKEKYLATFLRWNNKKKINKVFKKKKNYKRALFRFLKKKQKYLMVEPTQYRITTFDYMQHYKYYRFKMLALNFTKKKKNVSKYKYKYNYKNKRKINKRYSFKFYRPTFYQKKPKFFRFTRKYKIGVPVIFHGRYTSRRFKQIKRNQRKYLSKKLFRKYFKLSAKRKIICNNLFRMPRRVRKILPWRVKKVKFSYFQYQRFSYYWLRYFFYRFKKIYLDVDKGPVYYSQVKSYLLNWLGKVSRYKYLSLHVANPARGFLVYKSTQLYSKYKKKAYPLLILKRFKPIRYFLNRQKIDWVLRREIFKKRYMYRSLYWRYYQDFFERKKIAIVKRRYQFRRNHLPYVYTKKKHKMFYNWGDRHIFKRFPLYRYKYTLFFKFPRFADYRRLFKNQLREQHVFRYLYRLKLSQLIQHYRKSTYKTKRCFELMFLKHFELRLDTVVYRLNFAWSLKHARQLVLRGFFLVNNKIMDSHRYHISLGDVIMPIKRLRMQPLSKKYINYIDKGNWLTWNRLFYRYIQVDQYPEHFFLNERIPAGMLITNVNPYKLRYNKPFSLQYLTLSLLKYN